MDDGKNYKPQKAESWKPDEELSRYLIGKAAIPNT